MKKILIALLIVLFATTAFAAMKNSGAKSADALIATGQGVFYGIIVSTDSTNAVTLDIYDNTSASGTKLIPTSTITTASDDRIQSITFENGVEFYKGIYVDITCAGTVGYNVYYIIK